MGGDLHQLARLEVSGDHIDESEGSLGGQHRLEGMPMYK